MKRVYSIPFGTDFLTKLSEFILQDCQHLSDTAIVFAGKRPSLYLKKIFSETIASPGYSPRFFSIEEFIDYIVRKRFQVFKDLEYPDAIWLLYQSIQSLPKSIRHPFQQKTFGEFFYWGGHLLDFINRLDTENIQNDRLKSLEENAGIGYDVPESINELLGHVSILRDSFHTLLGQKASFTRGYKYLTASRNIEKISVDEFEKIYFAGLFGLLGTEKVILKNLWDRGKAEILLEGVPSEWSILKGFVTDLGADVESIASGPSRPETIKIYSGFDTHSEILKAHTILKENKTQKVAVILPLSDALFPLLTFVTDRINTPFNVAIGYPLERTPVFDLITHIIHAQASRQGTNLYPVIEYLKVMLHPFMKNVEADKGTRQAILDIAKLCSGELEGSSIAYKPFILLDEIEREMKCRVRSPEPGVKTDDNIPYEIVDEIHTVFFRNFESSATLYEYANNLGDVLEFILDHTSIRSYILSGEIFRVVLKTLENIKNLDFSRVIFHEDQGENKRSLCDFIIRLLQSVNLPFDTKPIESLEIIGLLESRNISFDTVIIVDANEGILPQQKKVDPLIPVGVHEMLGIPSPRQNEEIFRYYFERLVGSSKYVHILYIEAEDRPRSRYIEKIIWEEEKAQKALDVIEVDRSIYPINLRSRTIMPSIEKTSRIMDLLQAKSFSPSSIDNYLQCPVFFYYKDILYFDEKKTISDDIEATERGTIIHSILQDAFEGYLNKEITKPMHHEIIVRLHKVIDKHLKGMTGSGDYYLFKKLAAFKLESFLQKNLHNAPDPFVVVNLESRFAHTIEAGGVKINLTGKVDRVDLTPDTGQYMIIDYKTGGAAPYRKNMPRGMSLNSVSDIHNHISSFQLPVYIYLFHTQLNVPVSAVNAKLILLKNNTEEHFFKEDSPKERDDLYETYLTGIRTTILDIFNPARPFRPFDNLACVECMFSHLCHI